MAVTRELNRGNGKYCSKACMAAGISAKARERNKREPNVTCAHCSTRFSMSPSKMKNSKSGLYFCTRACKDTAQRIGGIKEIMPSHYGEVPTKYRELAFRSYPATCMSCGYDKYQSVLQVHHKDRDRTNNVLENLEVLCPTCHTEHHYLEGTGLYNKIGRGS